MADNLEFYLERAEQLRADAEKSDLVKVQDRCLRAARVWEQLADRAQRTTKMREQREAEAAERLAAREAELAEKAAANAPQAAPMPAAT